MSKQELPITSESDGAPVFRSELSDISSGSASAGGSNTISSLAKQVDDEKIQQSQELLRKGIEIQHNELTYDEKKPIGRGAYGQVYQGTFRREPVAIKIYDFRGSLSSEEKQAVMFEAQTMDQLRSKYLIGLRGIFFEPHYGLVMEYCAGGTLAQLLKKPEVTIDFAQQLQWGIQISYGLHALHSVHIFHRDLKGDNILLDQSREAKIGDFGLAQIKSASASQSKHVDHSAAGTIPWMAPELFDKKPHTSAADMYSLGMVLWEIISRQSPFHGIMPFVIIGTVLAGKRETIPPGCPKIFEDLITACWDADPSKRPSAEVVGDQFDAAWRSVSGLPPIVSELKQRALVPSIEPVPAHLPSGLIIPQTKREATSEERNLLLWSIQKGDKSTLENLLKQNISPDTTNENGHTLLYISVKKTDDAITKLLLDYRANVNIQVKENKATGLTPLSTASLFGNHGADRLLLAYKAQIDLANGFGETPLIVAAYQMHKVWDHKQGKRDIQGEQNLYTVIKILLDYKADVNKKSNYGSCALIGVLNSTIINEYCSMATLALIEHKADILYKQDWNFHHIIGRDVSKSAELVKAFIEMKADVNCTGEWTKQPPIFQAAWNGSEETTRLLLSYKADVNYQVGFQTPLLSSLSLRYDPDVTRLLLEFQADTSINIRYDGVRTILAYAQKEYKNKLKQKIEKEGSIKYINPRSDSSAWFENLSNLRIATVNLKKIIDLLEAHESKQMQLSTALFSAIDKGNYQLTQNALESKAIVTRVNKEGHSPLFFAAQKGLAQIVKLLLEYNAKINQAKQPGLTALATAAFRGHLEVVQILLEAKADPTLKAASGETVLQQALKQGHHTIVALLQPSSDQKSWREKKYNNLSVASSSGNSPQSVNLPPATEIISSSSSAMSSSATAVTSSSSSASVSTLVVSSEKTSTPTVPESKTSITDTLGTLFSTTKPKPKNGDDELRQPLIEKPQETDDSGKRCCLIL